jgi:hypothetical protein
MSNSLALTYLTNNLYCGLFLFTLHLPISVNLFKLRSKEISNENIMKIVNDTNIPLFSILLYKCILAYQN